MHYQSVAPVISGRAYPFGSILMDAPSIDALRTRSQELQEASEAIVALGDAEERDLTEDELSQIEAHAAERDRVSRQIQARERVDQARQGTGRRTLPDALANQAANNGSTSGSRTVPAAARREDRRGGFASFGEFALAVRQARGAQPDQRLTNAAATTYSSEGAGADGGFAAPPDFRTEIMERVFAEDSLATRCDRMPIAGNTVSMPIDMTTPWQATGGIQAYWTGEAGTKTQSKVALEPLDTKLATLAALLPITEELLEDAPAMDAYLRRKAPAKLSFKLDWAIAWGTGVGMPLGFMNSPALVTVAAEGAQTADTINATNISRMYGRMPVSSRRTAVWIVHPDLEATLPLMTIANQPVYLPPGGLADAPLGRLLGRPVIPHQVAETIGDLGDIMFVDLQQYLLPVKRGNGRDENGIRTDVSIHLWFDQDLVAYRFTLRAGGQPWWSAAVAMRDGNNTMSPFITLASR